MKIVLRRRRGVRLVFTPSVMNKFAALSLVVVSACCAQAELISTLAWTNFLKIAGATAEVR